MWIMPLHLHVNQKSDYDYDDMMGNFFMLSLSLADFFKKLFQEHYQSDKQLGPKLFQTFCKGYQPGAYLCLSANTPVRTT